jgi:hypothetical protein
MDLAGVAGVTTTVRLRAETLARQRGWDGCEAQRRRRRRCRDDDGVAADRDAGRKAEACRRVSAGAGRS